MLCYALTVVAAANFSDSDGNLPSWTKPTMHIMYQERVINVRDDLPKFFGFGDDPENQRFEHKDGDEDAPPYVIEAKQPDKPTFTCHCGKHSVILQGAPLFVGLCHCADCRIARLTPVHHGVGMYSLAIAHFRG